VPIDVAMEEPGTRIVCEKADCDLIPRIADAHNIPNHRVVEVVNRAIGTANYMEVVSMQMDRVLSSSNCQGGNRSTMIRKDPQVHPRHQQEW